VPHARGFGRRPWPISRTAVGNYARKERSDPEKHNDVFHPPACRPISVEIGHSIGAPYAGMVLGELGAEVIKVSPPIGNSIPSIVMDDGTLSPVVIGPIANPINAHAASAHNCRDHGQPPSMRMPHDERRQCKDLTHRQIDLAANQRQTLDDPLATSFRSGCAHGKAAPFQWVKRMNGQLRLNGVSWVNTPIITASDREGGKIAFADLSDNESLAERAADVHLRGRY
jgi:hypothetical protein